MELPNTNGVILYEGPSMLDGAPIVVIAVAFVLGSVALLEALFCHYSRC